MPFNPQLVAREAAADDAAADDAAADDAAADDAAADDADAELNLPGDLACLAEQLKADADWLAECYPSEVASRVPVGANEPASNDSAANDSMAEKAPSRAAPSWRRVAARVGAVASALVVAAVAMWIVERSLNSDPATNAPHRPMARPDSHGGQTPRADQVVLHGAAEVFETLPGPESRGSAPVGHEELTYFDDPADVLNYNEYQFQEESSPVEEALLHLRDLETS